MQLSLDEIRLRQWYCRMGVIRLWVWMLRGRDANEHECVVLWDLDAVEHGFL